MNDRDMARIALGMGVVLITLGCGQRTATQLTTDQLKSRWLEHISRARFGPNAREERSQSWHAVKIAFTSSQAENMRRDWLLLLPRPGQPRPESLGFGRLISYLVDSTSTYIHFEDLISIAGMCFCWSRPSSEIESDLRNTAFIYK